MVTERATDSRNGPEKPAPLTLEIFQGAEPSRRFPVRVKSLSARGVILISDQAPRDLLQQDLLNRDSLIHLPQGEVREIRGNILWAHPRNGEEGDGSEMEFGLELGSSNLKVRRALEDHLQNYPPDLKNLWDHWDAVQDEHTVSSPGSHWGRNRRAPLRESGSPPPVRELETPEAPPASDNTVYLVGFGAVLVGLAVYFLAPEAYRLFGVILSIYGSLTIAGKSVWSLLQRSPRSQG